ncbi:PaaI family thioesterase [Ammoniphilus resinae]|uniref:Uncharacterized protein (TIGR00369 family) n=1 Tax=Ammoniphilus resinae TaxID=861532 RepID=A0ABS4GU16_9BACL|nr:PaaI family thioesterase [Ammoniphilus resinae]MBP1933755.1 uncharacterized protein (TIGR00369 family) [Ammoniphilus resinae]
MRREELTDLIHNMSEKELDIIAKAVQAVGRMRENDYPFMGNFLQLTVVPSNYDFSCSMPITRDLLNPYRIVYGGVTAMMADMAMGWMLEELIEPRDKVVTLDMNVNYHNPGRGKELIAHCTVVHRAQNVMQASCTIVNDKDELVVTSTGTFFHLVRSVKG